jgi:hypothetical protein
MQKRHVASNGDSCPECGARFITAPCRSCNGTGQSLLLFCGQYDQAEALAAEAAARQHRAQLVLAAAQKLFEIGRRGNEP